LFKREKKYSKEKKKQAYACFFFKDSLLIILVILTFTGIQKKTPEHGRTEITTGI
jgi:branched-subunit amino acid transport protein AzlD